LPSVQGRRYRTASYEKHMGPTNTEGPRACRNKLLFVHHLSTTNYSAEFERIRDSWNKKNILLKPWFKNFIWNPSPCM